MDNIEPVKPAPVLGTPGEPAYKAPTPPQPVPASVAFVAPPKPPVPNPVNAAVSQPPVKPAILTPSTPKPVVAAAAPAPVVAKPVLYGKTIISLKAYAVASVTVIDMLGTDTKHYFVKVSHGRVELGGDADWGTGTQVL